MRPSSILALALLLPLLSSPALGAPADDPRPIVPASEILAKIERGEPVEYDGVIVVGDIDLNYLDPANMVFNSPKGIIEIKETNIVNSSVSITNSEIRGDVDLGSAVFQELINFDGTNFTKQASFSGANFSGSDEFSYVDGDPGTIRIITTKFCGSACFRETKFSGGANFNGAKFSGGKANFIGAKFSGGEADFWKAEFSGGMVDFALAVFSQGDTDFEEAVFSGGDANFRGTVFSGGDAEFGGSRFSGGGAYFGDAVFSGGDADFSGAVFSSNINLEGISPLVNKFKFIMLGNQGVFKIESSDNGASHLDDSFIGAYFGEAKFIGGDVNFNNVQFRGGDANFKGAEFSKDAYFESSSFDRAKFTLEDAKNIRILRLQGVTFQNESKICLNGTNYQRLYVHWDSIKNALVYNGEVYQILINNFKNIEYFEDADDCYFQYRRERQSMRSWFEVATYTDIFGWVTCGYGVRPGTTLLLGLFVVLVSAVYYWRRDAIRRLKGDEDESAKFSDAFYFSMMTFTTVGYGDWYPQDRHRNVVMIEGIVGWLTLSLFLVTLANVIIR